MNAKEFLQGRVWWREPIHPAMVHLPVGLWVSGLIFDIINVCRPGNHAMVLTSFWCIVGGLVGALLAIPFGVADWWDIKSDKPAHRLGILHLSINGVVWLIFVIDFAIRVGYVANATTVSISQLILTIVGDVLLLISGYIGGLMVYDYGTAVGRFSKHHLRDLAIAGGANVPEKEQ